MVQLLCAMPAVSSHLSGPFFLSGTQKGLQTEAISGRPLQNSAQGSICFSSLLQAVLNQSGLTRAMSLFRLLLPWWSTYRSSALHSNQLKSWCSDLVPCTCARDRSQKRTVPASYVTGFQFSLDSILHTTFLKFLSLQKDAWGF